MKTMINESQTVIYTGSFEDIIFENRNKEYGSYQLRINQNKSLSKALLITLLFISGIVSIPLIINYFTPSKNIQVQSIEKGPVEFEQIDIEELILPPPPPAINIPKELVQDIIYKVPEVVSNPVIEQEMPLPDITPPVEPISPQENNVIGIPVTIKEDNATEEIDTFYYVVQENALFQGGDYINFRNWLSLKIKYPDYLIESGVKGKVYLEFSVNKFGEVCDIKIIRSIHPLLDKDLEQMMKNSPIWQPAKMNGMPVKQRFSIFFSFRLD